MKKIKYSLVLVFFMMLTLKSEAQPHSNKLEIGFSVNQFQNDFGLGIHLVSPYFMNSSMAIKAGTNVQWFEHLNEEAETTWTPYQNIHFGVRSRNAIIEDKIIIYGEGGAIAILPNNDFSSEDINFGGYGVFGFEFRPFPQFAYYIEMGGIGSGATADRIIGKPIYSNGFLINVGFRIGI